MVQFKRWRNKKESGTEGINQKCEPVHAKKKKVEMGDNTSPNDVEILLLSEKHNDLNAERRKTPDSLITWGGKGERGEQKGHLLEEKPLRPKYS